MVAVAQDVKRSRQAKVPPVPDGVDDLSRDGLLFLLHGRRIDREELILARQHELSQAAMRASETWRRILDIEEAAWKALAALPITTSPRKRQERAEADRAHARATQAQQRAWAARMRAQAVADAFREAHRVFHEASE